MTTQERTSLLTQLEEQIARMSLEDQLELLELLVLHSYQDIKKPAKANGFEVFPIESLENQFKQLSEIEQQELLRYLFAETREIATKIVSYIWYYDKDYFEALNYRLAAAEPFNPDDYYDDENA